MSHIESISPALKSRVSRYGAAFLVFGVAKSAAFFAPLVFSNTLPLDEYGVLEFALGLGAILAMVTGAGVPGSIPYFLLRRNDSAYKSAFNLHAVVIGSGIALSGIAYVLGLFSVATFLSLAVAAAVSLQAIYATQQKVNNAPIRASLLESGIYLLLLGLVGVGFAFQLNVSLPTLVPLLGTYALTLAVASISKELVSIEISALLQRYREVLAFGLPLILTSVLMMVMTNSGRVISGYLLSPEDTGIYSFAFRISASVVLIHQLVTTLLFKKIYNSAPESMDNYIPGLMALIAIASTFMYLASPFLLAPYFPLVKSIDTYHSGVFGILSLQMVLWVSVALVEMLISKYELGSRFAVVLGCLAPTYLLTSVLLSRMSLLDLELLCTINVGFIFMTFFAGLWLLSKHDVQLGKTFMAGMFLFVAYAGIVTVRMIGWG